MSAKHLDSHYLISAVSSRRGVVQGLLVLTGIYAIALGLTEEPFFGDAIGFSLAAVVIVAAARFLPMHHPVMRLVVGMSLFGAFLLKAAITEDVKVMTDMAGAGVIILVVTYVLQAPGKAIIGVRGIRARRLFKKAAVSYDEIAAVTPRQSRIGLIKNQVGLGHPTVDMTLFSGKKLALGIDREQVPAFMDEMSQLVEPADDDNYFFMPTTASAHASPTVATGPANTAMPAAEAAPAPAANRQATAPRNRGRGRKRGGAS